MFPTGFGGIEIRGKPVFHALGQGDFAVAGDELIEGHLFGDDGIEAVVVPLGVAEIGEHLPVVFGMAGTGVEGNEILDGIARSTGGDRLCFVRDGVLEFDPVFADVFGNEFVHDEWRDHLPEFLRPCWRGRR